MIATLRHRLIRVPARLVRHAGALKLRLPPGHYLLDEVLARIQARSTPKVTSGIGSDQRTGGGVRVMISSPSRRLAVLVVAG